MIDGKLNVLIVAPGSVYSTWDVYRNYLTAFRCNERVARAEGFALHNVLIYHSIADKAFAQEIGTKLGEDNASIMNRAVRELLLDVIEIKPDVVLFIAGDMLPVAIYRRLIQLRSELHRNFLLAGYVTEAPYIDEVLDRFTDYLDIVFTNDKNDLRRRDPNGERFVFYLPHSYSPDIHYPKDVSKRYQRDVFFCGSLFPERATLLTQLDLSSKNVLISSPRIESFWAKYTDAEKEWADIHEKDGTLVRAVIANSEVANYYRGSKISLNMHRSMGWTTDYEMIQTDTSRAYSFNPRLIEIIACGGFPITDYRPEITDVFGDSVAVFRDAEHLNQLINYYLEHPDERQNMIDASMAKLKGWSFDERAKFVTDVFIEALQVMEKTKHG